MKTNKSRGFSLVEVVIVLGLLSGVAMIVMNLTKQSAKSSSKFQFDTDVTLATNEITSLLSDPTICLATFGSTSEPTNVKGKYYIKSSSSAPFKGYGNAGLQIQRYRLNGTATDGVLTIEFVNKGILKGTSGPTLVTKTISIYFEGTIANAPSKVASITKCMATSKATSDIWSRSTANKSNIFYIGNVGVNNSNPTVDLDVGAPGVGTVQAGKFLYSSDLRLKKNITPLENSLDKIISIRGVSFDWKESGIHDVGVIAQEVQKQIPEVVYRNPRSDKLSVDYSRLVPYLIEALKKQQKEIDHLKMQINKIQNE